MGRNNIFMPMKYEVRFDRWDGEKVKAILKAMFVYQRTGEVKNLPPEYMDAFDAIRDDMDIINEAYEERCRINAENGKKGGRPKKRTDITETEKTEWFLEKPKKPLREEKKRKEKRREIQEEHKGGGDLPFYPLMDDKVVTETRRND